MDKGGKHPSPKQTALATPWDSVEPDSEGLTQERHYQQQLQIPIGYPDQYKYKCPQKDKNDSFKQDKDEDEDETEDLQVYDSLEVESHPHSKRNINLLQMEYLDTHINQREGTSQLLSSDSYSELRYDPNWRTNLKRNGCFNENQEIYIKEYNPEKEFSQPCGDRQGPETIGGYRYIVDTSPFVVETPHMAVSEPDQPYHLHPQDGQISSVASLNCHKNALQLRLPHAELSAPSSFSTVNGSDNTSQRQVTKKCENDNAENINTCPELTGDIHALESQTCYQQELRHTQGGPSQTQKMRTSMLTSPKVLWNKKLERQTKDIVERNKTTLGRNTSKCGSYVKVHAFKKEMPHDVSKVHESLNEAVSTENQEEGSDPELRWLQKSQELQVTQISKGKRAQRKEYLHPSQQQQPPALGVRTERQERLSSRLARPVAVTQRKPQKMTLSQTLPTTIHLNINLNTSSHLLSLLQQEGQDSVINLTSLLGNPHWSHASKIQLALSPGNKQTDSGKPSLMSPKRLNAQFHQQNVESSDEHCQRNCALKLPLCCDGEDQNCSPNEIHIEQVAKNFPRTSTTALSQTLDSYPVLPPIGTGKEHELSPGQCVNTARPIHKSSSDSYLNQMEKQKQLREKVTYKVYNLRDNKQLKADTNLRDLGSDHTSTKKTKLYSNAIYEQNKTISRIPFLLAKDPEANDKKVPRLKALEYAKTIAKPSLQSQPKQQQKQHAPYLQGLDSSQLATLELLRKRHEEEKQAVANFRKVHAV